jgi:hypothetical protein
VNEEPTVLAREHFDAMVRHERELRLEQWSAHAALHREATRELQHTIELLNDVRSRFVSKDVYERDVESLRERAATAEGLARSAAEKLLGRAEGISATTALIGAISIIVSMLIAIAAIVQAT